MTPWPGQAAEAVAAALAPDLVTLIAHLADGAGEASPAGPTAAGAGLAGRVRVRLSGDLADVDAVAAVLAGRFEVAGRSGPRANRYEPGQRIYLTLCPGPAGAQRRA